MIQSVKKELAAQGVEYSFAKLCEEASAERIESLVDAMMRDSLLHRA